MRAAPGKVLMAGYHTAKAFRSGADPEGDAAEALTTRTSGPVIPFGGCVLRVIFGGAHLS